MTSLSIAFVLAGSVLVSAAPEDRETTERTSYTDKGEKGQKSDEPWIEIADPTPASHYRETIVVDGKRGPWTQLRITAAAGRPIVRTVRIEYAGGKSRLIRLDKVITKQRPAYVDLGGARHIERVIVTSEGSGRSLYAVHGATAQAIARR